MKVPTRRWGNFVTRRRGGRVIASMKVPTRRWGNCQVCVPLAVVFVASMKVPTRRWGNFCRGVRGSFPVRGLNESPHPKVGKSQGSRMGGGGLAAASMKVPTRRWGNLSNWAAKLVGAVASMKVPTRRWGNVATGCHSIRTLTRLNESPHPKVGKSTYGNWRLPQRAGLNESPHPKVGKCAWCRGSGGFPHASMKVPTRRWGNTLPQCLSSF